MTGYKRVNYYELCRLCGSNDEKIKKIDLFQDEGRKLQLLQKIETCLRLTVSEDDCLPNVVCNVCVDTIEQFCKFRRACVGTELMLKRYYNHFKDTEGFRNLGEVYIKEGPLLDAQTLDSLSADLNEYSKSPQQESSVSKNVNAVATQSDEPPSQTAPFQTNRNVVPVLANVLLEPGKTHVAAVLSLNNMLMPAMPGKTTDDGSKKTKYFSCTICCKNFRRRENLYQHLQLHSGYRPYRCDRCEKTFLRKEHLMRHATAHSGVKDHRCEVCGKTFSRNDNLNKHKRTHLRGGVYVCSLCKVTCYTRQSFMEHKHDAPNAGVCQ